MSDILKLGSQGPEVTIWQNFLTSRKLPTDPDGKFGPKTFSNTKIWQFRAGVETVGNVTDQTLKAAFNYGLGADNVLAQEIVTKVVTTPALSDLALYPQSWNKITQINASKLAKIAPVVAKRVMQFINAAAADGVILQVVQGLRTFAEQDSLYAQGRSRPGKIVTNAKGGQSLHNYGLAVDLAPVIGGEINWDEKRFRDFNKWDDIAGLDWGGNWKTFKDLPHVQDTDGMNLKRVQELYRSGGLSKVWANVT